MKMALFYHYFAHYREPVLCELDLDESIDVTFFADNKDYTNQNIEGADVSKFNNFELARCYKIIGPFMWQKRIVGEALKGTHDYYVFLGNPYYLATWVAAFVLIIKRVPFAFWTIGWFRESGTLINIIKNLFFSLPDKVFVYNHFNRRLMQKGMVFSNKNVSVVYNSVSRSLLYDVSRRLNLNPDDNLTGLNSGYLICVTRLVKKRGLDLVLKEMHEIQKETNGECIPELLIVGDGPEKEQLIVMAKNLAVKVEFWGACYDSDVLELLYRSASATVAPRMIGLTAIQSIGYGCPVITHGNMYRQAPEAESVIDGETGYLFEYESDIGLRNAIISSRRDYLEEKKREEISKRCVKEANEHWSAEGQAKIILNEVLGK